MRNQIPHTLRWLFPYKTKPLPFSTEGRLLYFLFQNKIVLTAINWTFQGMRGMGRADLNGKIYLEFIFFTIGFFSLSGNLVLRIAGALVIAHTINWFVNSHFWDMGRFLGITRTDPARFLPYLKRVMDRVQRCSSIGAVIVIGGISRKQGAKETSDIDIFFVRMPGFINAMVGVIVTIRERVIAFFHKFPLHLELYDRIEMMDKHRKDETPFVLKDVQSRATSYYIRQGREIAGFEEYEKETQTV